MISYTDDSKTIYLNNLNTDIAEKAIHIMTSIKMIARRFKALREAKLSLQRSVHKFVTLGEKEGKDWRKSSLLNVISSLKTTLYDVNSCISKLLDIVDNLGYYVSTLHAKQHLYVLGKVVNLTVQENFYELTEDREASLPRYIKQRTEMWHNIRKTAKATGSTINTALGLDSSKNNKNTLIM